MDDFVTLYLKRMDVGQMLDGLHERLLVWRATYEYLETGYPQSADYIEECSHSHEALAIADYYQSIITTIENQLKEQENQDRKDKG